MNAFEVVLTVEEVQILLDENPLTRYQTHRHDGDWWLTDDAVEIFGQRMWGLVGRLEHNTDERRVHEMIVRRDLGEN